MQIEISIAENQDEEFDHFAYCDSIDTAISVLCSLKEDIGKEGKL